MIVPTINRTRILPRIGVGYRAFAMKIREEINPLPPNFSMDAIRPPPHGIGSPQEADSDPMALVRKPVTAAYSVDAIGGKLSALDSSVFGAGGEVQHGTFGKINADGTIPLEYLALLRPAAEGAAALREMDVKNGTLLVYGATRPSGMAATQLASGQGCAVVAVVDGQHSGHDEMVDVVKGLTNEPGFAVAEEYALCKANFRDLVLRTVGGEDIKEGFNSAQFLDDFQRNLIDYTKTYRDDLPAAVDAEQLRFVGKEKDRANFKANMEAYLSQYSPGAAPIDEAQLKAIFDTEQYELFKKKFGALGGNEMRHTTHLQTASKTVHTPHGQKINYIARNIKQAQYLAALVAKEPQLELLTPVPLNLVNFRYTAEGLTTEALNALNKTILVRLQEDGIAVPSGTTIRGQFAIRVAITNHRSEDRDFDALVAGVLSLGRQLA